MKITNPFKRKLKRKDVLEQELLSYKVDQAKSDATRSSMKSMIFCAVSFTIFGLVAINASKPKQEECTGICYSSESQRLNSIGYLTDKKPTKSVYVLEYKGMFTKPSAEEFERKVEHLLPRLKKSDVVILSIDSPGGEATSCPHSYRQVERIKNLGVKVVSSTEYMAASCAYMLASVADEVTVSPGGTIGNIGAAMPLRRVQPGNQDYQASTPAKRVLVTGVAQTPEEKAFVNEELKRLHNFFVGRVEKYRGDKIEDKETAYSGRKFIAETAVELGVADSVIDQTSLLLAYHVSGYEIKKVEMVYPSNAVTKFIDLVVKSLKKSILDLQKGL
jgi:ClpP class serine protease